MSLSLRDRHLHRLQDELFDVLVIGSGINGAVSANALAGQGAQVGLIDKHDFAGFTSQSSSNLAWGGIKYMETFEFPLVRQLCQSRNRLIRNFPSSVQEIRFLTTVRKGFRHHPLKLWAGTWLYWLIGNGFTRIPQLLSAQQIKAAEPTINVQESIGGFEYSDAYLYDNDSRFVFNFIRTAMNYGCAAANYVESLGSRREGDTWLTEARDRQTGQPLAIRSKVLINAAGPFVDELNQRSGERTEHHHVYSKGIHLIVERISAQRRVLAFFADDGRLFFAIPMGTRTCIGTTDTRVDRPVTEVTDADRQFVLDNINRCLDLDQPLTKADIIAERCGVRPLALRSDSEAKKDFLQLSRKHAVDVNPNTQHMSIFGGKLTDCINVGEEVSDYTEQMGIKLAQRGTKWYGEPGADVRRSFFERAATMDLDALTAPGVSESIATRLWRRYGDDAFVLLDKISTDPSEAEIMIEGTEFLRCEIELVAQREMIVKLEDFLRRRSKMSLVVAHDELKNARGLLDACTLLFGHNSALAKYEEYFAEQPSMADAEQEPSSRALNW